MYDILYGVAIILAYRHAVDGTSVVLAGWCCSVCQLRAYLHQLAEDASMSAGVCVR